MTSEERGALSEIREIAIRLDERVGNIKEDVGEIKGRLNDHLEHHDDTRQIVTAELAKCQARHGAPMSGKSVAAIVTAACAGLAAVIAAILQFV